MTSKKDHPASSSSAGTQQPVEKVPESVESRLDEALEESFPASDPIAIDAADPHDPRTKDKGAASPVEKKRH